MLTGSAGPCSPRLHPVRLGSSRLPDRNSLSSFLDRLNYANPSTTPTHSHAYPSGSRDWTACSPQAHSNCYHWHNTPHIVRGPDVSLRCRKCNSPWCNWAHCRKKVSSFPPGQHIPTHPQSINDSHLQQNYSKKAPSNNWSHPAER